MFSARNYQGGPLRVRLHFGANNGGLQNFVEVKYFISNIIKKIVHDMSTNFVLFRKFLTTVWPLPDAMAMLLDHPSWFQLMLIIQKALLANEATRAIAIALFKQVNFQDLSIRVIWFSCFTY